MSRNKESLRKPIRIGLLGAGTWALHGHVRVLSLLPDYQLVSVYARRPEVAQKAAQDYGFKHVATTVEELVSHPEVDMVVVATTAPQHADGVKAALAAGKAVYSEWPLTTTTAIAQELVSSARDSNARTVVGLQRRLAPHNRYLKDLLSQNFVGELRSVRIHVSIPYLGVSRGPAALWTAPVENFSNVVTIYAGHFLDMLFAATGWPTEVSAIQMNQFTRVTDQHGNELKATSLDQLVMLGRIAEKGALSVHIEGGKATDQVFRLKLPVMMAFCASLTVLPLVMRGMITSLRARRLKTVSFA